MAFWIVSGGFSILAGWYATELWRVTRVSGRPRRVLVLTAAFVALLINIVVFGVAVMVGLAMWIGPTVR
jgi:hypothetical protein